MHLYVAVKGYEHHLTHWRNGLLAQVLPKYKDGKHVVLGVNDEGKVIKEFVELAVSPIQILEIRFPKEELDKVLGMVCPLDDYVTRKHPVLGMTASVMRKTLGLKSVPPVKPEFLNVFTQPNNGNKAVAVVPIGIKEDIMSPDDGRKDAKEEQL